MSVLHPSDGTLQGSYYSGSDSRPQPATLTLAGDQLTLTGPGLEQTIPRSGLRISPRIGNTPRYLHLPGAAVFETRDNDQVDALAQALQAGGGHRLVHLLENHLGLILIAAVITAALTVLTFTHGIPLTARVIAHGLPAEVHQALGQNTLSQLDRTIFSKSALDKSEQQRLRTVFGQLLSAEKEQSFRVEFRGGQWIGANALALPDGTMIFTDELIELAETDEELLSILAHEMGHVVHRHGLQGVVQSSMSTWIVVMMTGDLSAASDLTIVAPAILMNLSYSRRMEREADQYALALMQQHGLDPIHFANIMRRLSAEHGDDHADKESGSGRFGETLDSFLSTHPGTEQRVRAFEEAQQAH